MNAQQNNPILAFDPGVTTGVALLTGEGEVLFTAAVNKDQLKELLYLFDCADEGGYICDVVIECGPLHSNSPTSQSIEAFLLVRYSSCVLVSPSQWKQHPQARSPRKFATQHEKDAVALGRWYQVTRREHGSKTTSGHDSARTHSRRSGH